ncbi:MAG: serine/threonine protein kinase [Myxococcales bacterium]|nr:serine/threonine protein kinase [Myxococcales bacterium]
MGSELSFGRYRLLERIAVGGMAEIFLAKVKGEAGFEKTCVVKRVLPHLAANPEFVRMFLDEARLAAQLNHPGIVQIFDLGRQHDDYFIAMEHLVGEDGSAVLSKAREAGAGVPVDVAVKVICAAAEALHYAHELRDEQGTPLAIVHRDVSPSNLFVTCQGVVKVLDFGIARAESRAQRTEPGQLKGKAAYMAPEQVSLEEIDRRADVWALGVCLDELLTGERLFQRPTLSETAISVCKAAIRPPSVVRPELPVGLDGVVARALTRDAARRLPTALALRDELEPYLGSAGVRLDEYLERLFGREHLRRRSAGLSSSRGDHTERLVEPARTKASTMTVRGPAPGRRWTWLGLGAIAAGVLSVLAAQWPLEGTQAPPSHLQPPLPARPPLQAPRPQPEPPPQLPQPGPAPKPQAAATPAPPAPAQTRASPRGAPRHALLSLTSNVPAVGYLDGVRLGALPISRARASAGAHRIRVASEELAVSRSKRLTLKPGEEAAAHFAFEKGTLNVNADPWADVWLDGLPVGQTPLSRQLWEGRHRLRLVGPAGEKSLTVEVIAGKMVVVQEKLP